jgi:transglutaminase-like putative cysteine protease
VTVKKEEVPLRSNQQNILERVRLEALSSTPFIQSDHPDIQRQARDIIAGIEDPLEQVKKISAWVYQELRKQPVVSIPSALDVLRERVGDCNEHSVLFTALVRAIGIPARLQAGIVYQEGKFFYHAWAQVYLGSWISVDPTLNQIPADATHIRLVEGDLDKQLDLVKVVGRLKVEVLEVR